MNVALLPLSPTFLATHCSHWYCWSGYGWPSSSERPSTQLMADEWGYQLPPGVHYTNHSVLTDHTSAQILRCQCLKKDKKQTKINHLMASVIIYSHLTQSDRPGLFDWMDECYLTTHRHSLGHSASWFVWLDNTFHKYSKLWDSNPNLDVCTTLWYLLHFGINTK